MTNQNDGIVAEATSKEQPWIAGFWHRLSALVVDVLIMAIIGFTLGLVFETIFGLVFESLFVQMGKWGSLIGVTISLLYFGVMNSSVCGGQTLGKKLFKIKVVDANNQCISLGKSLLRYSIFTLPFSLNNIEIQNGYLPPIFLGSLLAIIVLGGMFSIIYLFVFNRVTRQSLHDLIMGTFVVNTNAKQSVVGKVWRGHIKVVVVFCISILLISLYGYKTASTQSFKGLSAVQSVLSKEEGVSSAKVEQSFSVTKSLKAEDGAEKYLNATITLDKDTVEDADLARYFATILAKNYPEATKADAIYITLTHGYDIGIASKWSSHTHPFDPKELIKTK